MGFVTFNAEMYFFILMQAVYHITFTDILYITIRSAVLADLSVNCYLLKGNNLKISPDQKADESTVFVNRVILHSLYNLVIKSIKKD